MVCRCVRPAATVVRVGWSCAVRPSLSEVAEGVVGVWRTGMDERDGSGGGSAGGVYRIVAQYDKLPRPTTCMKRAWRFTNRRSSEIDM